MFYFLCHVRLESNSLERKAESLMDRSSWRRLETELTRSWFIGSDEGKEEIGHWWSQQSRVQLPRRHGEDHARKLLKDSCKHSIYASGSSAQVMG